MNDAGVINRAAVPGAGSSVGRFDKNGVGAMIIGSNGNGFVQEAVEVFKSAFGFVIAASSNISQLRDDRTMISMSVSWLFWTGWQMMSLPSRRERWS